MTDVLCKTFSIAPSRSLRYDILIQGDTVAKITLRFSVGEPFIYHSGKVVEILDVNFVVGKKWTDLKGDNHQTKKLFDEMRKATRKHATLT